MAFAIDLYTGCLLDETIRGVRGVIIVLYNSKKRFELCFPSWRAVRRMKEHVMGHETGYTQGDINHISPA